MAALTEAMDGFMARVIVLGRGGCWLLCPPCAKLAGGHCCHRCHHGSNASDDADGDGETLAPTAAVTLATRRRRRRAGGDHAPFARGCASLEEPGMLRWRVLVRSSMGKETPN